MLTEAEYGQLLSDIIDHIKALKSYLVVDVQRICDPYFIRVLRTARDICDDMGVYYDSIE